MRNFKYTFTWRKDTGDRQSPGMFGHMRFPDLREVGNEPCRKIQAPACVLQGVD